MSVEVASGSAKERLSQGERKGGNYLLHSANIDAIKVVFVDDVTGYQKSNKDGKGKQYRFPPGHP